MGKKIMKYRWNVLSLFHCTQESSIILYSANTCIVVSRLFSTEMTDLAKWQDLHWRRKGIVSWLEEDEQKYFWDSRKKKNNDLDFISAVKAQHLAYPVCAYAK